jgi:hypothetical protein
MPKSSGALIGSPILPDDVAKAEADIGRGQRR